MSVEYWDNSATVCLIAIVAEGTVSAAESWKDHVSSSIKIQSDDGGDGEKDPENERGSGREEEERFNEGIKERFNDIFEIHMYLRQASWMCFCVCVHLKEHFFLWSSMMPEDKCMNAHTQTHTLTHRCKNTQKLTDTHKPIVATCSCHTHTQINWRISASVTHRRKTKTMFIYAQHWCIHLNISRILFHSNFTTSFWAWILCLKYFGSKIRPYSEETNDSDRSVPEKGLLVWKSGFKMSCSTPWEGLSCAHKQNPLLQLNI